MPDEDSEKEGKEQLADARETFFKVLNDLKTENMQPPEGMDIPSDPKGQPDQNAGEDKQKELSEKTTSSKSARPGDTDEHGVVSYKNYKTAKNIKMIMKVLEGSFQRSIATKTNHPGGMPRKWKKMDVFELEDSDPLEFFLWSANTSPNLPRVQKREKESTGGELAVLRDVSTSMMGIYSEWASAVVRGVIELARNKSMRVGYLEFNHKTFKKVRETRFFTKEYQWLLGLAASTDCSGNTNYEDALGQTLVEFRGRGRRNKHILFITDGIPTSGDLKLEAERKRASQLGIRIHSIFIGSKNYPKILQNISEETGGTQFVAFKDSEGIISIERKDKFLTNYKEKKIDSFDPIKAAFTVMGNL